MVTANNLSGHRERYAEMKAATPPSELGARYVGGGDIHSIGFREREMISRHHDLRDASVIDIGCGIGRLARYLVNEPLKSYIGTDLIPELLDEAAVAVDHDARFRFAAVTDCIIPADDGVADIVCAFSVMTHLLDEEIYNYVSEAARALRQGGQLVFSFFDFGLPKHQKHFRSFSSVHKERRDVLKWIEKPTIDFFARSNGFSVIEYVDGTAQIRSRRREPLLNGEASPETYAFGQSLVWLKRL